jgi:hypothetical protein
VSPQTDSVLGLNSKPDGTHTQTILNSDFNVSRAEKTSDVMAESSWDADADRKPQLSN